VPDSVAVAVAATAAVVVVPVITVSVVVAASRDYDSIAHAMGLLIFQSFGVEDTAVSAMLEMIQEMKFFLRTAFGDSREFAGLTIEVKTQGLGQGNGASPAGWCIISIIILRALKGTALILLHPYPKYAIACQRSSTSMRLVFSTWIWKATRRWLRYTPPCNAQLITGESCSLPREVL
jgi:hypothetical protein